MASFISVDSTAAQVIILNTIFIFSTFSFGLQYAASALIGKTIGAQNIKEAKALRKLIMIIGFTLSFTLSISLLLFRS